MREKIRYYCKVCRKETDHTVTCSDECLRKLRSTNVKDGKNPMFGKESWCKGLTKETDLRVKQIGEKLSKTMKKQYKEGRVSYRKGTKFSKESCDKVSENHADFSGELNPNFGNLWSEEQKENMRRENNPNFGKPMSEETKEKIRFALIGSKNHRYGKPIIEGSGWVKRYYYNSPFQGVVSLKGSYEYKYALYLDRNKIPWLYEPKAFPLNIEGRDTTYTPDFLLLNERKFIDTKGYLTPKSKLKIDKFRTEYSNLRLEVLFREDLQKSGIRV